MSAACSKIVCWHTATLGRCDSACRPAPDPACALHITSPSVERFVLSAKPVDCTCACMMTGGSPHSAFLQHTAQSPCSRRTLCNTQQPCAPVGQSCADLYVTASGVEEHPAVRSAAHTLGERATVEGTAVVNQLVMEKACRQKDPVRKMQL